MVGSVHIGIVKAEPVRTADEQSPVGCEDDAPVGTLDQYLHVLEPLFVFTEPRPSDALHADLEGPPLFQGYSKHLFV